MKKNISSLKFIAVQVTLMIVLLVGYIAIYLNVVPNLKLKCDKDLYRSLACNKAYKCDCSLGEKCRCQHKNKKGNSEQLTCYKEVNTCQNAIKCNCEMCVKCTCQHKDKEQELVCPIEEVK